MTLVRGCLRRCKAVVPVAIDDLLPYSSGGIEVLDRGRVSADGAPRLTSAFGRRTATCLTPHSLASGRTEPIGSSARKAAAHLKLGGRPMRSMATTSLEPTVKAPHLQPPPRCQWPRLRSSHDTTGPRRLRPSVDTLRILARRALTCRLHITATSGHRRGTGRPGDSTGLPAAPRAESTPGASRRGQ